MSPRPVPQEKLAVSSLVKRMRELTENQDMIKKAQALGETMRNKPDVIRLAVEWIEKKYLCTSACCNI